MANTQSGGSPKTQTNAPGDRPRLGKEGTSNQSKGQGGSDPQGGKGSQASNEAGSGQGSRKN